MTWANNMISATCCAMCFGAGLHVLFNKATRTNLALDYAWGKFGSKGFFLNLNESF